MHRQYVHIGARTLGYLDSAPGDRGAPVLVLVHAFPLAANMWEPQFKQASAPSAPSAAPPGWRLLAPDLRGFGGTPAVDGDLENASIDDYAKDVIDLLSELGIDRAVMGGLSMGGYVTFAMLRRAADRVRGLVLADTKSGADTLEARGNRRNVLALLDREGPSGIARDMAPKLVGPTTQTDRPELEAGVRRLIKQQSAAAIRGAVLRLMERPDSTPQLASIRVPTLVLVGRDDAITPVVESQRMADAIPGAQLVIVPKAGHLSSLEQPEAFNAALSEFLATNF